MDTMLLAYLAGAMDSDGYFTIKRSTYHKRVRHDATNAVYSERVGLKQTSPIVAELLRDTFGGSFYTQPPQTENSRMMYVWVASDKKAAQACADLLPYLRIKRTQAETLLELRETKDNGLYKHQGYWFAKAHPDWQQMELLTSSQAYDALGYSHPGSLSQAIRNGHLLSLPYDNSGQEKPRIPKLLVERISQYKGKNGFASITPPELVDWRESLYQRVKELNKLGINGTPIYHRSGPYTPAG